MSDVCEYRLVETCSACPEQYDVFRGGTEVAYLRLRHGEFRAECGDTVVYTNYPTGDGRFADEERAGFLGAAVAAVHVHLKELGLPTYVVESLPA